jgi:hypothetical protein
MAEFSIRLPFVTVTSAGGPHDDDSYVAGWEMGRLAAMLEWVPPTVTMLTVPMLHRVNLPQADLIGMDNGFVMKDVTDLVDVETAEPDLIGSREEWAVVIFTRQLEAPNDPAGA